MISELFFSTAILLSGSTGVITENNKSSINPMSETWEYVDELEDGAVYFIRNALYDSKVLDVPNGNYSNNTINLYLFPIESEVSQRKIQDKCDEMAEEGWNLLHINIIDATNVSLVFEKCV